MIMMRELLQSDFDRERLKSMLEEIAEDTENKEISAKAQKGDVEGATEHFFAKHFTLPE